MKKEQDAKDELKKQALEFEKKIKDLEAKMKKEKQVEIDKLLKEQKEKIEKDH